MTLSPVLRLRAKQAAFAVQLVAVAVCGLFAIGSPAMAEVPFQQYKEAVCSNALCKVDFAGPPTGKRLAITSESCEYTLPAAANIVNAEIDMVGAELREFLVPVLVSSVPVVGKTYAANQATLIYVPVGPFHLRAIVSTSGTSGETIACKISGTVEAP